MHSWTSKEVSTTPRDSLRGSGGVRGLPSSVLALQRAAGNRAAARVLARSRVETDVVSPAVRALLDEHKIKYAREVTFVLLDSKGNPMLKGRFDIVFRHPVTQELIFPELKGDKLWALTDNQEIYVLLFESEAGAQVQFTSRIGGPLLLAPGSVEHIRSTNFFRIGTENMNELTAFVQEAATGQRPTHFYYNRGKLLGFNSKQELHAELAKPETGVVVERPRAKPGVSPGGEKPLKPPDPHAKPPPSPLHDPPTRTPPPALSSADPLAGPPENRMRKGPNLKPQPADHGLGRPAGSSTSSGGASSVVGHAEEAASRAEGVLIKAESRLTRTVYKIGAIAEALLPGPLDALMLMVDYFGAWADAKDEALRRSFVHGFELGLAAGLIGLEQPWVDANLRRRFADKDVISELIGVTGLSEVETNKGQAVGLSVGAAFPAKDRAELLEAAFGALVKEGVHITDKREIFTIEMVARLSRVLRPWSDAVFEELGRFVQSIGDSTTWRSVVSGRGAHSSSVATRTRAVWLNVAPGITRLMLLTHDTISADFQKLTETTTLEEIPARMARLAIRRTVQRFGEVETMDGPLMPPRREPVAAMPRRQPIAAGP